MRVLLVDDNAQMRELFKTVLESDGIEVVTANDAISAIFTYRHLDDGFFDFVLSDYQMPRMNGVDFLLEIRKLYPKQKFALLSADPPSKSQLPAELKDLVILEKPIRNADLLAAVKK